MIRRKPSHRGVCIALSFSPQALFAVFICGQVARASTLLLAGWTTFCKRMPSNASFASSRFRLRPSRGAVPAEFLGWGRGLCALVAGALAALAHTCLVAIGVVCRKRSVADAPEHSLGVWRFSQPVQQQLSLVASFRSLQTSPRIGSSNSMGALVPFPGPSGGTAWRL